MNTLQIAEVEESHDCRVTDTEWEKLVVRLQTEIRAGLTTQEIIRSVLNSIRETLRLNRVVFAMLSPSGNRLHGHINSIDENVAGFESFVLDISNHQLFSVLMKKQQAVWLNPENKEKLWSSLPADIKTTLGNEWFYAMSVFSGKQPFGLVYADCAGIELDAERYRRFKSLCVLLSQGLLYSQHKSRSQASLVDS